MELSKEYILYQYQELGMLDHKPNVKIVRNSITGKIAVKKLMDISQLSVYTFLKYNPNPFVPEIYEYLENGQQLIVIEEYIEGRNLEDILSEQTISAKNACGIIRDLCLALEPLHAAVPPIVCRDLKPENIMLTPNGHVKFIDFDIARVVTPGKTQDTELMGTADFAAPEQFGRRQTDGRSDIYALGILLNYLILHKLPVEAMIEGNLRMVVLKCTAMNPDERYQTVKELRIALEEQYPPVPEAAPGSPKEPSDMRKKEWRRFLPPGFRSGSIWKMILACLGYLMLIDFSLSLDVTENDLTITGLQALPQQISFLLTQFIEIGFIFNYMGCREKTPILRSPVRCQRVLGYIVMEFILFMIVVVFWMFCETLHSMS